MSGNKQRRLLRSAALVVGASALPWSWSSAANDTLVVPPSVQERRPAFCVANAVNLSFCAKA